MHLSTRQESGQGSGKLTQETPFWRIVRSAGFLNSREPGGGLTYPGDELPDREAWALSHSVRGLGADALYRSRGSTVLVFKDATASQPNSEQVVRFQSSVWNSGIAPVALFGTRDEILVLDGFARPTGEVSSVCLRSFGYEADSAGADLERACGRLAIDTGAFWESELAKRLNRKTKVDAVLLEQLGQLDQLLRREGASTHLAQKLIGRTIFAKYLVDKGVLSPQAIRARTGHADVQSALRSEDGAHQLFNWIRTTFNGDLFPPDVLGEAQLISAQHLQLCAAFLDGEDLVTRQLGLFPFRFDVIPVEMISSIYEQFAHASAGAEARGQSLHYTPVNLVQLVLDRALSGVRAESTVLDPACGSGMFLVESFRRLVRARAEKEGRSRKLVRDVLHRQLHGVDINPGALQVAAFSLYLAALELDPDLGEPLEQLRFEPLIGRNLQRADFLEVSAFGSRRFDVIVGNPPWTYAGKARAAATQPLDPVPARSPDWSFLWRARLLASDGARIGFLMKATPFFSKAGTGIAARRRMLEAFCNVQLVNMSQLRGEHLFPSVPVERRADDVCDLFGLKSPSLRRANHAPAMLFSATVGTATQSEQVTVANVPWTPGFRRHGVFAGAVIFERKIDSAWVGRSASILKGAFLCNTREFEVMESLARSRQLVRLRDWLDARGLTADQGLQLGGGDSRPSKHLRGLPLVSAADYSAARIKGPLPEFTAMSIHRPREPRLFEGPIVLCPEAGFAKALEAGRYSSAFTRRSCAFTDSFVGIAFGPRREREARALAAIFHSKPIAFQLAFGSSNVGIKQPKIEGADLDELMIPDIAELGRDVIDKIVEAEGVLGTSRWAASLKQIDQILYRAYGFNRDDSSVVDSVLDRSKSLFFDTNQARLETVAHVTKSQLAAYAGAFSHALNRLLASNSYFRVNAINAVQLSPAIIGLKITLNSGGVRPSTGFEIRQPELFEAMIFRELEANRLPGGMYKGVTNGDLYILKSAERRFWTVSDAQGDAVDAGSSIELQAHINSEGASSRILAS